MVKRIIKWQWGGDKPSIQRKHEIVQLEGVQDASWLSKTQGEGVGGHKAKALETQVEVVCHSGVCKL